MYYVYVTESEVKPLVLDSPAKPWIWPKAHKSHILSTNPSARLAHANKSAPFPAGPRPSRAVLPAFRDPGRDATSLFAHRILPVSDLESISSNDSGDPGLPDVSNLRPHKATQSALPLPNSALVAILSKCTLHHYGLSASEGQAQNPTLV